MKRLAMLIVLLVTIAILTACAGPSPRPVIIKDDKVVKQ